LDHNRLRSGSSTGSTVERRLIGQPSSGIGETA
jgi:hypothetical protein